MIDRRPLTNLSRRQFCALGVGTVVAARGIAVRAERPQPNPAPFRLNYIVASPMYGTVPLATVLKELKETGADTIDIWPRPHADHREQIEQMGLEAAQRLLEEHGVRLGACTRYDLGPNRIADEIPFVKQLGGKLLVCGATPLRKGTVKEQVRCFVDGMNEHVERAAEHGITIGIENHSNTVLHTPDSVRYFAEFATSPNLGLAMAPYHLPQEPEVISQLIEDLADKLVLFQAWEHGLGCTEKLPKEQELMQLPGRGTLDFKPLVKALKQVNYQGWTEIFMHPVPRGMAIRETPAAVTSEINAARNYLDRCVAEAA